MSVTYGISTNSRYVRKPSSIVVHRFEKSQYLLIETLSQNLNWLRVVVPAHLFSADRASFRGMKGSRPLLDIPSYEVLGAINPNEVAGPHSPSTSCARRPVWGNPNGKIFHFCCGHALLSWSTILMMTVAHKNMRV